MNFPFFLAWRYLKSRKSQGFVSVMTMFSFLGIMLGVATLIIVMSVMNGYRLEVMNRILGFNGHLTMTNTEPETSKGADEVVKKLRENKEVVFAAPLIEQHALVIAQGNPRFGIIRGMFLEDLKAKTIVSSNVREGTLDSITKEQVGIGKRLSERFGIKIGDLVSVVSPQGVSGMFGMIPRMASFKVGFIFEVGAREYDESAIFMSMSLAQKFFKMKDTISSIEVFLKNPENADMISKTIQGQFFAKYKVTNWQKANTSFMSVLIVQRNVMFLILALIIVIAAFNIITSLVMLVQQKTKDIAILRTMGASRKHIMLTFFFCGRIIGIVGTILGVVLGVVIALNLDMIRVFFEAMFGLKLFPEEFYWLSKMPSVLLFGDVFRITLLSLFLSFVATIYPARKASELKPLEALRYE